MSKTVPAIDIMVQAGSWPDIEEFSILAEKAISAAVFTAKLRFPLLAELSLVLSDDKHVQALNQQWRKTDKPTNVLSFPVEEIEPGECPGALLGDIVLSHETILREADEQEKPVNAHVSHLIIHGFLHIFGYDHENHQDAEIMEDLERRSLDRLGLPDPFSDTTPIKIVN